MNIAVMAPHTNKNGVTTVASLISLEMALNGKTVCLSHIDKTREDLHQYFKLRKEEDKTNNADQLEKLLVAEAIQPEKVRSYCKPVTDELDIFSSLNPDYTPKEHEFMLRYICGAFPHEIKVFDIDVPMTRPEARDTILESDLVVLVLTQDIQELRKFSEIRDVVLKRLAGKPLMVVINRFNPVSGTVKECATVAGVKRPNNWFTISYNPWLQFGCNTGELADVHRKAKSKDRRVLDIDKDLDKIANAAMKLKIELSKKSGGKAKAEASKAETEKALESVDKASESTDKAPESAAVAQVGPKKTEE